MACALCGKAGHNRTSCGGGRAEEDEVEVKDANVLVRPRHGDHARHGHAMVPVERIVEWR